MPDSLNYHSGWGDFSNATSGLNNSLMQIAFAAQQRKAQQDLMQQEMALKVAQLQGQQQVNQAHIGLYGAEASHHSASAAYLKAQTDEKTTQGRTLENLGADVALLPMLKSSADSGIDVSQQQNVTMGNILRNMAMLPDKSRSKLPENIAQVLQMGNPVYQQALGLGGVKNLYQITPQNAVSTSPITGVPPVAGPYNLPSLAQHFNPQMGLSDTTTGLNLPPQAAAATNPNMRPSTASPLTHELASLGNIYSHVGFDPFGAPIPTNAPNAELAGKIKGRIGNVVDLLSAAGMTNAPATGGGKQLTKDQAAAFLKQAQGDKAKARQLARDAGYSF